MEYTLPLLPEKEIMEMEDKIYRQLCGNALTGEVAAWLSILHSHFMRLNNQVQQMKESKK